MLYHQLIAWWLYYSGTGCSSIVVTLIGTGQRQYRGSIDHHSVNPRCKFPSTERRPSCLQEVRTQFLACKYSFGSSNTLGWGYSELLTNPRFASARTITVSLWGVKAETRSGLDSPSDISHVLMRESNSFNIHFRSVANRPVDSITSCRGMKMLSLIFTIA